MEMVEKSTVTQRWVNAGSNDVEPALTQGSASDYYLKSE